jgi:hypothetical protein
MREHIYIHIHIFDVISKNLQMDNLSEQKSVSHSSKGWEV